MTHMEKGLVMKRAWIFSVLVLFVFLVQVPLYAGENGTKEEAVAMVKKAIEFMKANGNEKAFERVLQSQGEDSWTGICMWSFTI